MRNEKLTKFVFVLGREQELAASELKSVLLRFSFLTKDMLENPSIFRITGNLVFANMDKGEGDVASLIDSLAGTIKIFKLISSNHKDSEKVISSFIQEVESSKLNFGISSFLSEFSQDRVNKIGFAVRKRLKGKRSCRFVELREGKELSSILTKKNDLIGKGAEFGLFSLGVGLLIALNDPEEWSKRDYDKPQGDKFSGMVPPKLARMMVNIVLGQLVESQKSKVDEYCKRENEGNSNSLEVRNSKIERVGNENCKLINENCARVDEGTSNYLEIRNLKLEIPQHEALVADPFCGSGNILTEALLLGCDVLGSDNSPKAVNDTRENLNWLYQNYQIKGSHKISIIDATKSELIDEWKAFLSTFDFQLDNFVIVTEPYLGEPKKFKPTYNAARGEYGKLKNLFLEFLKNLSLLSNLDTLKLSNIIICIVFPIVETSDKGRFSLYQESVDEIRKLGYTHIRNNFVYGREYQVVKREIVLLELLK